MSSDKIIVKVGKKSTLRFSHTKAFRAITIEELKRTAKLHDDCHIVVIESIDDNEQDELKSFLKSFESKNENNKVLFYIPDSSDDITSGIADELEYNIYLTPKSLYNTLSELYNMQVSIFIDDKVKTSLDTDVESSLFGNLLEANEEDLANTIEKIDKIDESSNTLNENDNNNNIDNIEENIETAEEIVTEPEETVVETKEEIVESNEVVAEHKEETETNVDNSIKDKDDSKDDSETVRKIKLKLRDAEYDYAMLNKDMGESIQRISSLENIVTALREEKNAIISRYNEIVDADNDVLENPITLSEYEEINNKVSELNDKITELNATIDALKLTIDSQKIEIDIQKSSLKEYEGTINSLKHELKDIRASIESGEIHKEVIEEYTEKLDATNHENESLHNSLKDTTDKLQILQDKCDELTKALSDETASRISTYNKLKQAFNSINQLRTKISQLENSNIELSKEKEELLKLKTEQDSSIVSLSAKVQSADKRVEAGTASVRADLLKKSNELESTKIKLDTVTQQLSMREKQYNDLISTSGIDENGASALLETNRTLEGMITSLREQCTNNELTISKLSKDKNKAEKDVKTAKNQIEQLSLTLETLTKASSNGANVSGDLSTIMQPIQYSNARAQIISVFGSSSVGITNTAMSLAYRLYTTSRVLFIDYDIVSPKADAWFAKVPLCKGVSGIADLAEARRTGLGIFYEKGVNFFNSNLDKIIINCENTKGGCIDYLSGIYYNVDKLKFASADYTRFISMISNNYDYIIFDLGKIGYNELTDKLIKNINDVSGYTVVVTTSDKFEVRNLKAKLMNNNIKNITWLLNMCSSTNIDKKTLQIIGNQEKYGIVPFEPTLYGKMERINRTQIIKDKFECFINSVLFANGR